MLQENTIYCGDNLDVLKGFEDECINLFYGDPQFFTQKKYETFWGDAQEQRMFEDVWVKQGDGRFTKDINTYLNFMEPRLREIYRVLKPTGSFYLHCFPTGMVLMADGSQKDISDVKENEKVFAAPGIIKRVEKVWKHHFDGNLVVVKPSGNCFSIKGTPNHEVFVIKKSIKDENRRRLGKQDAFILENNIIKCRLNEVKNGDYLVVSKHRMDSGKKILSINKHHGKRNREISDGIPDVLVVDEKVAKVLGYYLGDGRVTFTSDPRYGKKPSGIDFTINIKKKDVIDDIVFVMENVFCQKARFVDLTNRNVMRIYFCNTSLGETFLSLFGTGSLQKKIHPEITSLDESLLRYLIEGWALCDGHKISENETEISSSGMELVKWLYSVSISLGMLPRVSISNKKTSIGNYHRNADNYRVVMQFIPTDHALRKQTDKYVFLPINDVSTEEYHGNVYNLSVEDIHSYQLNGMLVSNCDYHANSYLRILCDQIFGYKNLVNEIIWWYKRWSNVTKNFQRMHETIYFYTKSKDYTFNIGYQEYAKPDVIEKTIRKKIDGKLQRVKNADGSYVARIKENKGVPFHDVFDIQHVQPTSGERLGYPTQKPEALLNRIIKASSNENDIVLDAWAGCGTALAVARKLNRKFVAIDISPTACRLIANRIGYPLQDIIGLPMTAEEISSLTGYEFQNAVIRLLDPSLDTIKVNKKGADGGIDGSYYDTLVSVKKYKAGRKDLDEFVATMYRNKEKEGIFIALGYSSDFIKEIARLGREQELMVHPFTVEQIVNGEHQGLITQENRKHGKLI